MHSTAVESYLLVLICRATEQEKFSTRNFDTCQIKRCCDRVRLFRMRRSEQSLSKAFLVCSSSKSERHGKESRGWGAWAPPESLILWLLVVGADRETAVAWPRIALLTFSISDLLFGFGGHCKATTLGVVTCDETSSVLICPWQGLNFLWAT